MEQKQSLDLRPGKRFGTGLSNENLRIGANSARNAKRAGTLDESRSKLNFEVGKGGVIMELDKKRSIPKRIKAILEANNISDPNKDFTDEDLKKERVGTRTYASFILQGSHDTMVKLAFADQRISFEPNADNSHLERKEDIEKWGKDMYKFIADKYGEDNIAAFIVHLDETTPHVHCVVVPITQDKKLSFRKVFAGGDKYEFAKRTKALWDEAAKVSEKYGLARGDDSLITGAHHKSYLQWMREMIFRNKGILDEQDKVISDNKNAIDRQKQTIYNINAEIKKAETKMKSFSTMISNLEAEKETLEAQVAALSCEYDEEDERYEKKHQDLNCKLADLEEKLSDKRRKYEDVAEQLEKLGLRKVEVQSEYDDLKREINKETDVYYEKVQQRIESFMWKEIAHNMKSERTSWEQFSNHLSPELKEEFDNLFNESFIGDMFERANEISGVACALYLGFLDQATSFARDNGGCGSDPGSDWGRRKDEDDLAYMRRCCIMGRMMMRPSMSPRRGFRR